jgi:hypothetical protein
VFPTDELVIVVDVPRIVVPVSTAFVITTFVAEGLTLTPVVVELSTVALYSVEDASVEPVDVELVRRTLFSVDPVTDPPITVLDVAEELANIPEVIVLDTT